MVTLNKPSAGDVEWAGEVNSNWSSIESALNAGPSATLSGYENLAYRIGVGNITRVTALSQRPFYSPFRIYGHVTFNQLAIEMSRAGGDTHVFTIHAGVYTYANSTQLSLLGSASNSYSHSAPLHGIRQFLVTGFQTAATSLSPGNYNLMLYFSAGATGSMNFDLRGAEVPSLGGLVGAGTNNRTTATSQLSSLGYQASRFMGRYTATTNAPPAAVALSELQQWTSGVAPYFRLTAT